MVFLRCLGLSDFNLWEILLNYFVHRFPLLFSRIPVIQKLALRPQCSLKKKKSFIPFLYTVFGCLVSTKTLLGSGSVWVFLHWTCIEGDVRAPWIFLPGSPLSGLPWVPWSVPPLTVSPCTWSQCPRQFSR